MSDTKKTGPVAAPVAEPQDKQTEAVKGNEELTRQVEEWRVKYLRALADYQNLEKRMQNEREAWTTGAEKKLMEKLLPFLDNLDRAGIFMKDESLKLISGSFHKILEDEGLKELAVLGKEFDPYLAEVIDIVPGEKDHIVTEVLRKGYEFNGRILRVAQVKVSKKVEPAKKGN